MDFAITEAQEELAGLARRLLTDWSDKHPKPDNTGLDRQLWATLSRAGLLDAALPQSVGGGGFGLPEQCSVLVEIGRAVAPTPYLGTVSVAATTISEYGQPGQVERWVVPALRGDLVAAPALDAGLSAQQTENGWQLNGTQTAVVDGAFADVFLVAAGDALLAVDRSAAGVTVSPQHVVDGTDAALVEFDGVVLPDVALIGRCDAVGFARRRMGIGWCAHQLGVLERALELTAEYARTRVQFDKPIGSFQAVRQRLADAYLDVEAVRLTLWQAAWREAEGQASAAEIDTAAFWAAEAGHRVSHTAVHVHGGVGIDLEYPLHRYFTAAERAEFALGTATGRLRSLGELLAQMDWDTT